ncbi:MAG: 3-hydroxyacyl-CoA dehydrogenase NAD-binding domain-containing protein [Pseudomonadota bacterium]
MTTICTLSVSDGIATVTLDDPDSAVNTVSPDWIAQMTETFTALRDDDAVAGIILTSAKPGFMAGADLKFILQHSSAMTPREAMAFSQDASAMHRLIETCGKPVVAAMNGFALGGGYELALACTHRILSSDPRATVGLPEVKFGLLPGSGGTQRLPRLIGLKPAVAAILDAKTFLPNDALEAGLVDQVVAPDEVMDAARAWLATSPDPIRPWDKKGFALPQSDGLLKQQTASYFTSMTAQLAAKYGANYPAPIAILSCIFEGIQVPIDKALLVESRYFSKLFTGSVTRSIIRTNFLNKGLAKNGVRRPEGIEKTCVSRVGVLGAGMMGAGIACVSARAGIDVVLLDQSIEAAEQGKAYTAKVLQKALKRGQIEQEEADCVLERIIPTTDFADLEGVDLVVEAVFEDPVVKADVTAQADKVMAPDALFASNTSSLPISQLAKSFSREDDYIGLHFFSPVDKMTLVEVILGGKTGKKALARALDYVLQIRKLPIVVNDSRGFYTSRVFQTFIHEGMELLREGVAPALIENAAKQAGMPVGPLALIDETSISLPLQIVREAQDKDSGYIAPGSLSVMETMVEELGRPGRKGGGGFYEYPAEGSKHLWPDLSSHFPRAIEQPDAEDVKRRLLYIQALESVRCLEEGVLTHPADGDVGSVFGWGFPSWAGGTISLIESVGLQDFVANCDAMAQRHGERFNPTQSLRSMAESDQGFDWS